MPKAKEIHQSNIPSLVESLHKPHDARPLLLFLAGPNGSGKSSLFAELDKLPGRRFAFVNADQIAVIVSGAPAPDVLAQKIADVVRYHMVAEKATFVTESVFSDPVGAKLDFLRQAQASGFRVVMAFVALSGWEISLQRVRYRVNEDKGHDVPAHKLKRRFIASNENARKAASFVDTALFFDNGSPEPCEMLKLKAVVSSGKVTYRAEKMPAYIAALLPMTSA